MKKFGTLLLSLAALSSFSPAFAQTHANSATLTLGGGNYFFSKKRNIDNTGIPFFALGYNFTQHWGIEGLLGFFTTDSNNPEDNGKQVNGTLFSVDAMYHFNPFYRQLVEPYLMAGVGILGMSPNGTDAHNQGNVNAGAGVSFYAGNVVSFRIEARDFYTIVGGKNDVFVDGGVTFSYDFCK